jgi:hypothetical protein
LDRKEVGGEIFGVEKRAEKSLGKGRGCVFGSSPKQLERPQGRGCVFGSSPKPLEWPHCELVHWWLLVHSSRFIALSLVL